MTVTLAERSREVRSDTNNLVNWVRANTAIQRGQVLTIHLRVHLGGASKLNTVYLGNLRHVPIRFDLYAVRALDDDVFHASGMPSDRFETACGRLLRENHLLTPGPVTCLECLVASP